MMKAQIGSISQGTLRLQDLIPTLLEHLKKLEGKTTWSAPFWDENLEDDDPYWSSNEAEYDLGDLFEELNKLAPLGAYFGSHPGDGADFGFWYLSEMKQEKYL